MTSIRKKVVVATREALFISHNSSRPNVLCPMGCSKSLKSTGDNNDDDTHIQKIYTRTFLIT